MGQMTDFNREEVQTELREVIAEAHAHHQLWTTDWAGMQLKRCVVIACISHDFVECSRRRSLGQFDAKTSTNGKCSETQDVSLFYYTFFDHQLFINFFSYIGMTTLVKITKKPRRMH